MLYEVITVGLAALLVSVVLAFIYYLSINNEAALQSNVDLMIVWTVFLIIAALLFAFIIGPIVAVISNPKSLYKGLISFGALALIVIISYSLAKGSYNFV